MGEWSGRILKTCLVLPVLIFFVSLTLAQLPTVYEYDPQTGLWKRVDPKESEIAVQLPSVKDFLNSNVAIPITGTIVLQPPQSENISQMMTTKGSNDRRWYYYMTYPLDGLERSYEILAGQDEKIGTAKVKSQNDRLLVSFVLFDGWLADESHMLVTTEEPTNMSSHELAPGRFPYKQSYSPSVNHETYNVPVLTAQDSVIVYVLLHLSVTNGARNETAWGAEEEENEMCIEVSGGKINWYVKKPGEYVAEFFTARVIKSSHPIAVTFSGFDDLTLEGGGDDQLPVHYAFADDLFNVESWIGAAELNDVLLNLQSGERLNMLHKIGLSIQQSGTYRNSATITFTLRVVEDYIEKQ
ncbi:MAG: Uncharacterized protein XD58_0014 [Thermotoga sp. 50_1627]|uniref:hypothetical protein n=1 Tax=Pseudothermotoga sp. TaxID=2033661 RepID=UPI00076D9050|nr:MAG: Uncharacterized protein XD45_0003 [Thermotoga sp. 50_64]KUK25853.1 MAG: Uncharacterized protein XD58_0014 [Thermotoga sp. 50_1627]MBC7116165.1 hypothetical protein [Pseudothermotoga sp.]MDK2923578.1 hypothetical protein [Pseudothermotoga sp.]HCO98026.1 hypothetical protein [Pseudothermotoga sp.]